MTNPVFNEKLMQNDTTLAAEPMTINGAINKTFFLLLVLVAASYSVWNLFLQGYTDKAIMLAGVGSIAGFILVLFIAFTRKAMNILVPVYAACEGLFLGGISAILEKSYPGIAAQAIMATFAALGSMLFLYRIGAIKCTDKFRSVIFISTLSIGGIYLIDIIGSLFGMHVPQIFGSGNIGIIFSLIVVTIASLNLIIDFDFIERGAQNLLAKEYEWYGAFGLMVTLVWLYLEILRLLAKLRER